jgi:hypothetical protein
MRLAGILLSADVHTAACFRPAARNDLLVLCRRKQNYSIRKYEPFVVAEVAARQGFMEQGTAFRTLAGYLFGGNSDSTSMAMTSPVISNDNMMQFVLPVQSTAQAPQPIPGTSKDTSSPDVVVREVGGGTFAVLGFSGVATQDLTSKNADQLVARMERDGLFPERDASGKVQSLTLQYNEPTVLPPFRRNEVMVQIKDGFDLWQT